MTVPEKPLNQLKLEALTSGYFAREIAAPDAARDRADRSYAIAGAIGTLLLGAGVISGIGGSSMLVAVLGIVALVSWALTAALFVRAVGSPVRRILPKDRVDADAFGDKALELARSETQEIADRSRWARRSGVIAALLTLAAIVAAVLHVGSHGARTLILTSQGAAAVAQACGDADALSTRVRADLDLSSLDGDWVTFTPRTGGCPQLSVARDDVLAVAR